MNPLAAARQRVRDKFLQRCAELRVQPGQPVPRNVVMQFPIYLDAAEHRVCKDVFGQLVSEGLFEQGGDEHDLILTEAGRHALKR